MVARGRGRRSQITQRLRPEEVEAISYEIARLEHVPPEVVDAVLFGVGRDLPRGGAPRRRAASRLRPEVLERAFGAASAPTRIF